MRSAADAKIEVELVPSRPWRRLQRATSRRTLSSGPLIAGVEAIWDTEPILQQTTLRAVVRVYDEIEVVFTEDILPSINGWWVVGPFHAAFAEDQLERVFEPERAQEVAGTYKGKGGRRVGWKRVQRALAGGDDPRGEFFVDFHRVFGRRHNDAVAYAMTTIETATAGPAALALGSDDGVVVWVNGQEVHRLQAERGFGSKQDRIAIRLRAGANRILLKVGQARGAWGFAAHIEGTDGRPVGGSIVTLD